MKKTIILTSFLIAMLSSSSCTNIKKCWLCEIWEGGTGYYITKVCDKSQNDIEHWIEIKQQEPNVEYVSCEPK